MRRILPLLLILTLSTGAARAESLVADLSSHLVAITTGFTGTELLLFGAMDTEGDVVVIVHGPREEVVVRRKDRVAGLWMNRDAVTFEGVPAFYHIAMTDDAPLDLPIFARQRHQIGVTNVKFLPKDPELDEQKAEDFREALLRNKQRQGFYTGEPGLVQRRGGLLFRTEVFFPANVPTGTYTIETLLVRDGEVQSAQTTPLFISKVGLGARIFLIAHNFPAIYGIAAILIAAGAGLLANWAFRKLG